MCILRFFFFFCLPPMAPNFGNAEIAGVPQEVRLPDCIVSGRIASLVGGSFPFSCRLLCLPFVVSLGLPLAVDSRILLPCLRLDQSPR